MFTEHFSDGQHQVGRRSSHWKSALQFESNDSRYQHRYWLAKESCLSFNSANAPTKNSKTINHGGVRVSSNNCIGISAERSRNFPSHNHARQEFNIHLVNNSRSWRHNFELIKGGLAPTEESITLSITLVFDINVLFK